VNRPRTRATSTDVSYHFADDSEPRGQTLGDLFGGSSEEDEGSSSEESGE